MERIATISNTQKNDMAFRLTFIKTAKDETVQIITVHTTSWQAWQEFMNRVTVDRVLKSLLPAIIFNNWEFKFIAATVAHLFTELNCQHTYLPQREIPTILSWEAAAVAAAAANSDCFEFYVCGLSMWVCLQKNVNLCAIGKQTQAHSVSACVCG